VVFIASARRTLKTNKQYGCQLATMVPLGTQRPRYKNSVAVFLDKRKCSAFDRSTTGPDAFDRAIPLAAYRGNGHVKSFHAGIRTAKYSF
jgi:hypothetical protein